MPTHLHRPRPRRLGRIGAILGVVAAASLGGLAATPSATADPSGGHITEYVCHPVPGNGELGNGWNLIPPDKASSHIDESLYPDGVYWKHETPDGRHDVFANSDDPNDPNVCPGPVVTEHLSVAQTITTSYNRYYDWTLDKSVDTSDLYLYAPAAVGAHDGTVHWRIQASATQRDADYLVSGSVDVSNDGGSDTTFTLTLDPAIASNIDCGNTGTATAFVATGSDVVCTYSVASQLTGDVTATATTDVGTYSDTDTITWGAPANVTDATVTLTDARLGISTSVAAATGYDQSFPETFTWAQNPCGNDPETNTASLSSGQSDSATLTVHRQCLVFQADTAWASGAGGGKYNPSGGGNWATYVKGPSGTYQLFAGQTKAAGSASISSNGTVTITLANGYAFAPASSGANVHIQWYSSPPSGNPSPGLFAFKKTCTASPCSPGKVTLGNYYGIHLAVGKWVPDPLFGP
jgi:hypothetical protein